MTNRHRVAYVLIGLGTITLLARLSDGAGWLWIGLVAAAMLFAYTRQRTYGLLVLGGFLAGTALGILLQEVFRNEAFFLISLGAGVAAIDFIEPRPSRWPRILGAVLAALGVLIGIAQTGAFGSVWFALLLIALGIGIIARGSDRQRFPPARSDAASDASSDRAEGATARVPDEQAAAGVPDEQAAAGVPDGQAAAGGAHVATIGEPPAAAVPGAPPAAPEATTTTDDERAARRSRLAAWREQAAAAESRAPQSILSDEVLDELAAQAPGDTSELAQVRGIGPVKLERYGEALLETLHGERY